ncbi:hypothetical protein HYI19_17900 [Clostridium botulinum]|uniref:hypothetical protein n=1 Tax=Clostridium botulinum TaxID=1491 RepID=UPI0013F097B1|nr:hypothetical protein [Clostridium botulinum]MBY6846668.1 hypothetical protein [Clostridium botulinum]NEZ80404.1 hypothetical protein [Clostridium botulinum]NFA17716.1 hypothetical protein [Clostridium botulinum]NFA54324.1 hypothetical protein [Clostridium botulinum]NFA67860.1 hypothetical protein [Clostridium botulinum]
MKKIVIGLLTALILGVNVSSAYAAEACPRCGATVGRGENHKCCDYLGHVPKKDTTGTFIFCTRCHNVLGKL